MRKKDNALFIFILLLAANAVSLPINQPRASIDVNLNQVALSTVPESTDEDVLEENESQEEETEPTETKDFSFTCPKGQIRFQAKEPSVNGCGGETKNSIQKKLQRLGQVFVKKFEACCSAHDVCYDICGENQKKCDDEFYPCLKKVCDTQKKKTFGFLRKAFCKTQAKAIYVMVRSLGAESFKIGQKKTCGCKAPDQTTAVS